MLRRWQMRELVCESMRLWDSHTPFILAQSDQRATDDVHHGECEGEGVFGWN
jgi:hypothetical protein